MSDERILRRAPDARGRCVWWSADDAAAIASDGCGRGDDGERDMRPAANRARRSVQGEQTLVDRMAGAAGAVRRRDRSRELTDWAPAPAPAAAARRRGMSARPPATTTPAAMATTTAQGMCGGYVPEQMSAFGKARPRHVRFPAVQVAHVPQREFRTVGSTHAVSDPNASGISQWEGVHQPSQTRRQRRQRQQTPCPGQRARRGHGAACLQEHNLCPMFLRSCEMAQRAEGSRLLNLV